MNSNKNIPFIAYNPTPEELAVGCTDFVEVHEREKGGVTEIDFGRRLADDILLDTAINEGLTDVPELSDEGDLWKIYKQRVMLGASAVSKCVECPLYESCSGASALRLEAGIVTPNEQLRRKILSELAREITSSLDVVLKGGFAMILHGINRSTDDIDLNTFKPLSAKEKDEISKIISDQSNAKEDVEPVRQTDTMVRWKIHNPNESDEKPLKVEIKTKKKPLDNSDEITTIDGIRVYKPKVLLRQKSEAYVKRFKGRDIVDVSYLLSYFPETIKTIDSELLEKVLSKLESNQRKDNDTIGLGELQSEEIKITLPVWLQDDKVLVRMLTEARDKIKHELENR